MSISAGIIGCDIDHGQFLVWKITNNTAHSIPIVQSGKRTKIAKTLLPAELDDESRDGIICLNVADRWHINVNNIERIGLVHNQHLHIVNTMMEEHAAEEREKTFLTKMRKTQWMRARRLALRNAP